MDRFTSKIYQKDNEKDSIVWLLGLKLVVVILKTYWTKSNNQMTMTKSYLVLNNDLNPISFRSSLRVDLVIEM